mgnify:CR=1 FL=1
MLRINTNEKLFDPDGNEVKCKDTMKYLGAQLSSGAQIHAELNMRLGIANQEFLGLERIWKHSNIPQRRKIQLYHSYVISKLFYGLQSV